MCRQDGAVCTARSPAFSGLRQQARGVTGHELGWPWRKVGCLRGAQASGMGSGQGEAGTGRCCPARWLGHVCLPAPYQPDRAELPPVLRELGVAPPPRHSPAVERRAARPGVRSEDRTARTGASQGPGGPALLTPSHRPAARAPRVRKRRAGPGPDFRTSEPVCPPPGLASDATRGNQRTEEPRGRRLITRGCSRPQPPLSTFPSAPRRLLRQHLGGRRAWPARAPGQAADHLASPSPGLKS